MSDIDKNFTKRHGESICRPFPNRRGRLKHAYWPSESPQIEDCDGITCVVAGARRLPYNIGKSTVRRPDSTPPPGAGTKVI